MPQFNIQDLSKDSRQGLHDLAESIASDLSEGYGLVYGDEVEGSYVSANKNSLGVYFEVLNKDQEMGCHFDAGYLMGMMRALEILFGQDGEVFVKEIMRKIK